MKVKDLIAQLQEEDQEAPLVVQYYTSAHAAIPEAHFEAVAIVMMNSEAFLEEAHELFSDWMALTNERLIKDLTKEGN
jgi:hypothetical protein